MAKCFYDPGNITAGDVYEYPAVFSKYYDIIYDRVDTGLSRDVYLDEIKKVKGNILELGTGTGRIFLEALKSGADIYGIDVSRNMIGVLRDKLPGEEQGRVMIKDMRKMNLGIEFDLIIAPFRVFSHIIEPDDQFDTLNNIYRHLKPGGRLIFDVFVPDLNILLNEINDETDFEYEDESGEKVRRSFSSKCDLVNQINNVRIRMEWTEGGEWKEENWDVPMRYYFRYELEHLIKRSQLEFVDIYGDGVGTVLTDKSKNYVAVGRKGAVSC